MGLLRFLFIHLTLFSLPFPSHSFPQELVGSTDSHIIHLPPTKDDPTKRKPDIRVAQEVLGWQPTVVVRDGLAKTVEYFRKELEETVSFDSLSFFLMF